MPWPLLSPESQTSPYSRQIMYSQFLRDFPAGLDMRYAPQSGVLQSYRAIVPWTLPSASPTTSYGTQITESQSPSLWDYTLGLDMVYAPQPGTIQPSKLMMPVAHIAAYSPLRIISQSQWDYTAGLRDEDTPQPDVVQPIQPYELSPPSLPLPTSQTTAYSPQIMDYPFSGLDMGYAPQLDAIQPSQSISSPLPYITQTTPSPASQITTDSPQSTGSSFSSNYTGWIPASEYVPQPAPEEEEEEEEGSLELEELPEPKVSRIPRPMNAFLLFRQHYQGLYKTKKLRSAVISKRAAEKWKKLSKMARDVWLERAHALAKEHECQFSDYQFKPDRTKRRKSMKIKWVSEENVSSTIIADTQREGAMMDAVCSSHLARGGSKLMITSQNREQAGSWTEYPSQLVDLNMYDSTLQGETSGNVSQQDHQAGILRD